MCVRAHRCARVPLCLCICIVNYLIRDVRYKRNANTNTPPLSPVLALFGMQMTIWKNDSLPNLWCLQILLCDFDFSALIFPTWFLMAILSVLVFRPNSGQKIGNQSEKRWSTVHVWSVARPPFKCSKAATECPCSKINSEFVCQDLCNKM